MSDKKNEGMSEEDYLKRHLEGMDNPGKMSNSDIPGSFNDNPEPIQVESARVDDLQYFNFDAGELPCGNFYPKGTLIMVRPAEVKEIQAYSMVDDKNFYDIVEKMNDMIRSCVRIKYPGNKVATYLEAMDQDRLYLIFLIRELTFQQGNSLAVTSKCGECTNEFQIELKRDNFVYHEVSENLNKYFDRSTNSYTFRIKNGKTFEIAPPNIGLQKAFTDYIIKENNEKNAPNLAFLKIIPFMLSGRTSITYEGIKAKLKEFEEMDDISFQFLNDAVGKMTFGIKELKKACTECGHEVTAEMQFPNGASGIFVIHNAFEAYIEE